MYSFYKYFDCFPVIDIRFLIYLFIDCKMEKKILRSNVKMVRNIYIVNIQNLYLYLQVIT